MPRKSKKKLNRREFKFFDIKKLNKSKVKLFQKDFKYASDYENKNEEEHQLDIKLDLYYKESQKRLKNLNDDILALKKREVTLTVLKKQLNFDINETDLAIRNLKRDENKIRTRIPWLLQLSLQEGQLLKEHGWITKKQKEQIEWFIKENKKISQYIHEEELLHMHSSKRINCNKKKTFDSKQLPTFLKPCDTLLKHVDTWKNVWIFEEDVDTIKYPSYLEVVNKPMSFSQCRENLSRNKYKNLEQFGRDVNQIWENAKKFNPPGNKV